VNYGRDSVNELAEVVSEYEAIGILARRIADGDPYGEIWSDGKILAKGYPRGSQVVITFF